MLILFHFGGKKSVLKLLMETKSFVFGFFYVKTLNFYHRKVACKVADLSAVKILAVQINTEYFLKSTTLCNCVQFGGEKSVLELLIKVKIYVFMILFNVKHCIFVTEKMHNC